MKPAAGRVASRSDRVRRSPAGTTMPSDGGRFLLGFRDDHSGPFPQGSLVFELLAASDHIEHVGTGAEQARSKVHTFNKDVVPHVTAQGGAGET